MDNVSVRHIDYGSDEYRQTLRLREDTLRKPWGRKLGPEDLEKDPVYHHIAAFSGKALVGCLVLLPLPDNTFRMKQVSVAKDLQGHGVGRKLVEWSEDYSLSLGFRHMILNARETAIGFYERLGYRKITGGANMTSNIPHWQMEKPLLGKEKRA